MDGDFKKSLRNWWAWALGFFGTYAIISSAFAAYSTLQTVGTASSWSPVLATEWNKMVSNLSSVDSQLSSLDTAVSAASTQISSLSSQIAGLSVNGGNPWTFGGGGISYSSGNVSIGTSNPSASFEVRRTASDGEYVAWFEGAGSANNGIWLNLASTSASSNVTHLKSGNVSRFLVRADGNVGIGNSSPSYALDVNGDVRFTGTLQGGTVPAARVSWLWTLAGKSAVASADITDATISTADIADAGVTDAKIAAGVSPAKLASGGATSGQILSWNGTSWTPAAAGGSADFKAIMNASADYAYTTYWLWGTAQPPFTQHLTNTSSACWTYPAYPAYPSCPTWSTSMGSRQQQSTGACCMTDEWGSCYNYTYSRTSQRFCKLTW